MAPSERPPVDRERAGSFGAAAAAYAEHRPSYPDAAVDLALPGAPRRVLDLGAGTGKLTASLVARDLDVVAVEPDEQMLAVLRAGMSDVDARSGRAESIPLPDRGVDAVVVGQALHWFDLDSAVPEVARVLRPGGTLAGLWNSWDRDVEWMRGATTIVLDGAPLPPRPGEAKYAEPIPESAFFGPGELLTHVWKRPMTAEAVLGEFGTHSRLLTRAPADREAILDRVRGYLAGRPETASGAFEVPMVTQVWRTLRR